MKVIIAGSRGVNSYESVRQAVNDSGFTITTVVSGTAAGVDRLGEKWASEHGIKIERYPANWNLFGKSAGYKRNQQMAEAADALIAVWDGKSRGTSHMIDIMRNKKKPLFIFMERRKNGLG